MCLYCWRSLSPLDRFTSGHLRWPFHSSRSLYVLNVLLLVKCITCLIFEITFFCPLQNFHKQFKEMAAVMETVWWLQALLSVCRSFTPCLHVISEGTAWHVFVCWLFQLSALHFNFSFHLHEGYNVVGFWCCFALYRKVFVFSQHSPIVTGLSIIVSTPFITQYNSTAPQSTA